MSSSATQAEQVAPVPVVSEASSAPINAEPIAAPVPELPTEPAPKEPEQAPVVPVTPAPSVPEPVVQPTVAETTDIQTLEQTPVQAPVNQTPAITPAPVQEKPRQPTEEEMWAMLMGDDSFGVSSSSGSSNGARPQTTMASSGLSGTSSSSSGTSSSQGTQNYQSSGGKTGTASESSGLSGRLEAVTGSAAGGSGAGANTKPVIRETEKTTDGLDGDINWTEGKSRKLIKPAKPDIVLSAASQQKIESSLTLNISFTVNEAGDIPIDSIKITPPLQWDVVADIQQYISRNWRFESSDTKGVANFTFTITVK